MLTGHPYHYHQYFQQNQHQALELAEVVPTMLVVALKMLAEVEVVPMMLVVALRMLAEVAEAPLR